MKSDGGVHGVYYGGGGREDADSIGTGIVSGASNIRTKWS
jgi:hypothetical protein